MTIRWQSPIVILALLTLSACRPPLEGPRLVVVIAVDQMRADYLDRFDDRFTGGFARLLRDGAVFTEAHQDHALTETAPGHAAISTGDFPSRNGIVQNAWYDRSTHRSVYSFDDPAAPIVGIPDAPGRSPANMKTTALGDWLKRRSPQSRTFSVAIKDRAAIAMGGKRPDGVYWYYSATGHFVTSVYYRPDYPEWVSRFNAAEPAAAFNGRPWERLYPESTYVASREDDFAPEFDGRSTTFPHLIEAREDDGGWHEFYGGTFLRSPFADALTLAFARDLVTNEQLGTDDRPDLLFIGLSAADYVGHAYGPYSQEVEDYYLRLDLQLDSLFVFLDQTVGRANYLVTLTADHGVMTMPEESARRGFGGARASRRDLDSLVVRVLATDSIAATITMAGGVVMDFPPGTSEQTQVEARHAVATALRQSPAVLEAYTSDELAAGPDSSRPYFDAYRRSFLLGRSADVMIVPREDILITNSANGTSHGSPHPHDTHVPLVFAGPGIAPGRHTERARTVDIAPTLAALLGVRPVGAIDGRVLQGVGSRE